MSNTASLLQRYFDASLIPADTGDERLGHYQSAANALAERFAKVPHEAIAACRVAVDPECPASEPWFETVQGAVKEYWKTFLANHHDAPRQVSRGILLDALRQTANKDELLSCAIWYAGSNLLNHHGEGAEQLIIQEVYAQLGQTCEVQASNSWRRSSDAAPKVASLEGKLALPKTLKIDPTELENGLSDAAGPHNRSGKNFGNPNPHWPNQGQPWSVEFSPRAAKIIATEVNKALATATAGFKVLSEQLSPGLNTFASEVGKMVADSLRRSERLTELVWWKNALYSPSLRRSYRGLSPVETVIVLTKDLVELTDAPVPLSVEYFMREMVQTLVPSGPHVTLAEMLAAVKTSTLVMGCLPKAEARAIRRVSLLELFALARQSSAPTDVLPALVGIGASVSLSLMDWAVWLLRENLAAKLVTVQPTVA